MIDSIRISCNHQFIASPINNHLYRDISLLQRHASVNTDNGYNIYYLAITDIDMVIHSIETSCDQPFIHPSMSNIYFLIFIQFTNICQ